MKPTDKLTPHFRVAEFFVHRFKFDQESWDWFVSRPPGERETLEANLLKLAICLEHYRVQFETPYIITSGVRCPLVNASVGGEKGSYHQKAMAADGGPKGLSPAEFQRRLDPVWNGGLGSYRTFTHVDIGPKRRWRQKGY